MSDGTKIEWASATWQPVLGCTRVSAGCENCYAISVVHRGMSPQHRGLTKLRPKSAARPGVDWNGTVRLQPEKLAEPLRWRKPRRVFVCSLGDLFHEKVPFEYIAAVFGVMAATPQHTYLVLTKRPERAREFFAWIGERAGAYERPVVHIAWCSAVDHIPGIRIYGNSQWPLPNVQLGVSAEDQATADERIPHLLACPAAMHWVSAEPLLEHVWLARPMTLGNKQWSNALYHLGWLVVGGESGSGARPFDIAWARSIIRQARGLPTRVFIKQLGSKPFDQVGPIRRTFSEFHDRKGGDIEEWPADLRIREYPEQP